MKGIRDALTVAGDGYRVLPVGPDKVPLIKDWPRLATTDAETLERWWKQLPDALVGIATGDLLLVVDLDVKGGQDGPAEWRTWCAEKHVPTMEKHWLRTRSDGGRHLYLRKTRPAGNRGGLFPGVDVRGDGGYVVAWNRPPALADLPAAPDRVEALLSRPEKHENPNPGPIGPERDPALGVHPYVAAAIKREVARLTQGEQLDADGWNNTTYAVACNLLEFANSGWSGYTREQAHADLMEHAPRDAGFGAAEIEKCWASAEQKTQDNSRPLPEGCDPNEPARELESVASDDFEPWTQDQPHPIFDATAVLSQIRQAAHARMVGSGALLCYVLGRVLAEVPPGVVLPPVVGGPASLNLAFALVGRSGSGKSSTSAVSEELLGLNQSPIETGVGSGEGLMEAYHETQTVPDPDNPGKSKQVKGLIDPPTRILEVDEIGHLGAVSKRDGSSLMPVIRTALTGGALKAANATAERRRNIGKGTYRLIVFVGIQPELAGVLLDDANAGTPQRFVWVSTVDKTLTRDLPEWPGEIDWNPGLLELVPPGPISYPEHVRQAVLDTRYEQVHGDGDPLKGHELLTRLKVSAGLAFLHGEIAITDQWWDVAGAIITWSTQEQARCQAVLNGVASQRNQARGRAEAEVEQAKGDAALTTIKASLVRKAIKVLETKDKVSVTDLRHHVKSTDRAMVDPALEELAEEGRITVEGGEYRGRPVKWVTHVNQG